MDNETPIAALPLADRLGHFAVPALHLWWRFFWRVLLLPITATLIISFVAAVFDSIAPQHRFLGLASAAVGLGILWLLLAPILALYGIWLMRRTLFLKPFLYHNLPHTFVVTSHHLPLSLPLPLENALAIWWGVTWRAWFGTMIAMIALFFLGPLHIFLETAITYLAFLWLLGEPYGHTRITVEPQAGR